MTLAEFVLARITEDEEQASLAGNAMDRGQFLPATGDLAGLAATFDPARVLAECEAKRRIVDEHAEHVDGGRCRTCRDHDDAMVHQTYPCTTLLELAQPYAYHPDFRDEWRL